MGASAAAEQCWPRSSAHAGGGPCRLITVSQTRRQTMSSSAALQLRQRRARRKMQAAAAAAAVDDSHPAVAQPEPQEAEMSTAAPQQRQQQARLEAERKEIEQMDAGPQKVLKMKALEAAELREELADKRRQQQQQQQQQQRPASTALSERPAPPIEKPTQPLPAFSSERAWAQSHRAQSSVPPWARLVADLVLSFVPPRGVVVVIGVILSMAWVASPQLFVVALAALVVVFGGIVTLAMLAAPFMPSHLLPNPARFTEVNPDVE